MTWLCEYGFFSEKIYRRIYDVLSMDGMLPDPCSIGVLDVYASRSEADRYTIVLRKIPPEPRLFAKKLARLILGNTDDRILDGLSSFVEHIAREDIQVSANPARALVETTIGDLVAVIRKRVKPYAENPLLFRYVANYPGLFSEDPREVIKDFFLAIVHLIPRFIAVDDSMGSTVFYIDGRYSERAIAMHSLATLMSSATTNPFTMEIVLEVIDIVRRKQQPP